MRARQVSEAVVGALQDGLVIFAPDGRIARVNERMCELTGFSEDELVGASAPLPYWPAGVGRRAARPCVEDVSRTGAASTTSSSAARTASASRRSSPSGVTPATARASSMIKDVAERAKLVAETHAAREAFARSADGHRRVPLQRRARSPTSASSCTPTGPGSAALLGARRGDAGAASTATTISSTRTIARSSTSPGASPTSSSATARSCEQDYRLVGVDGVRAGCATAPRSTVLDGRVLLTGAVRDISDQRRAEDERAEAVRRLEWLSSVDALTELFNRRHFSEVLRARLAGSAAGAAIALVDVDHFKRINDTHGHQIGDLVLREIARRLKDATRPCDVTSRWGGEEFCVLLDEIGDERELETLVERLRAAVSATPIADRRERRRRGHDLDRRRAAVARLPHARAAARERRRRALRGQARWPQPGAHRARRSRARPGRHGARASRASCRRSPRRPRSAAASAPMHCAQVAALSTAVAVELGLPAATVELARLGGWLHDCGKVTVPTDILAHRGPLDEQARARVRHHAIAGEALVSVVPGLSGAAQVVRSHHERFDGTRLPRRPGRRRDPARGAHRRPPRTPSSR